MDSFAITNNLDKTFKVSWSIPKDANGNSLFGVLSGDYGSKVLHPGQSVTVTHKIDCYRGVNVSPHGNGAWYLFHDCWRGQFVLNNYGLCAASGGHIRAWNK